MIDLSASEILDRLTPIFRDVFDNDEVAPRLDMTADDVEEWDSLSHIRLVVSIEKGLGVNFSSGEIDSLENVGDLVKLVQVKLKSKT